MKVKVTEPILDYDGKEIKEGDRAITFRDAISVALNSQMQNEILTGEQKAKAYRITIKVYDSNEPDLTLDDRAYIKERAEKVSGTLVLGRLLTILEDKVEKPTA